MALKRIKFVWIVKDPSSADSFSSVLDHLVQEASYVFLPVSVQINLSQYTGHAIGFSGCEIRSGRPDLFQILDRMVNITVGKGEERGKGVHVAVCGPNSLIRSSRAAVAQLSRTKSTKAWVQHSYKFCYMLICLCRSAEAQWCCIRMYLAGDEDRRPSSPYSKADSCVYIQK
jgi:hypothetical protein